MRSRSPTRPAAPWARSCPAASPAGARRRCRSRSAARSSPSRCASTCSAPDRIRSARLLGAARCGYGRGVPPYVTRWSADDPRVIVLIAHGFGEHAGRYDHVARRLVDALGAAVYAPDHRGHGKTDGATGLIEDGEAITA